MGCFKIGYRGRTSIFEFLEVTEPIKQMILQDMGENALRKKAVELGMISLLSSGFSKIKLGLTTIEEVLSVCPSHDAF